MIDTNNKLSVRKQCELLSIHRSFHYYQAVLRDDTELSNLIAEEYAKCPFYGYRRITAILNHMGYKVNHKKVLRLMREMNLRAIYPGPNTSKKDSSLIYPYLLEDFKTTGPNQAWQVDITYLRVQKGFMYLVALIDVHSRFIVGARLSSSLSTEFCIDVLTDSIYRYGIIPAIINSDQGSQFTSDLWIKSLQDLKINVSMTGKGRCCDNAHIERLWRSFKYEGSYLYRWNTVQELRANIPLWIRWYNEKRPHQSLNYKMPIQVHRENVYKSDNLSTISQCQKNNVNNFGLVLSL